MPWLDSLKKSNVERRNIMTDFGTEVRGAD
jgi:hypothetical protein